MPERVRVEGGADPYETAAIMVAIVERERFEAAARAHGRGLRQPPAWVRAARRSPFVHSPVLPEPGPRSA